MHKHKPTLEESLIRRHLSCRRLWQQLNHYVLYPSPLCCSCLRHPFASCRCHFLLIPPVHMCIVVKSALRANFRCNECVRRMHRQRFKQADRHKHTHILTQTHTHTHKQTHTQHTAPPSLCHHSQSFERHSFLSFWSPHMHLVSKTSFLCESDTFRNRFQVENIWAISLLASVVPYGREERWRAQERGMERRTGRRVSMFRAFRHMRRDDTDRKQPCPSHFAASVFAAPVCFGVSEHDAVKHVWVCLHCRKAG